LSESTYGVHRRFAVILSSLYLITFIMLMYVGETRVDAYISLYILEYLVIYSILSPVGASADRILRRIMWFYVAIFLVIVSLRIMEILGYRLWAPT